MWKLVVLPMMLFSTLTLSAQTVKKDAVPVLDSAALLQEMMDLLGTLKPESYVSIDVTAGNRLYSIHNRGLNAKQSDVKLLVYAPSVGYFHKSGFNITAGANFLNDATNGFTNSFNSLTAGYDLKSNKKFNAGISYTRYFVKDHYSPYASPVQNDLYASLLYKTTWLNPGIALGYSAGYYNNLRKVDTIINNRRRLLYDSATFRLKAFSANATLSHRFEWNAIAGKDDGLILTPTAILNFGSSTTAIQHNTNAVNLLNFLTKRGRVPRLATTSFRAESAGLSLDLIYSTGHFSFEPQWYMDYYIPDTAGDHLTQIITFTASYSF